MYCSICRYTVDDIYMSLSTALTDHDRSSPLLNHVLIRNNNLTMYCDGCCMSKASTSFTRGKNTKALSCLHLFVKPITLVFKVHAQQISHSGTSQSHVLCLNNQSINTAYIYIFILYCLSVHFYAWDPSLLP